MHINSFVRPIKVGSPAPRAAAGLHVAVARARSLPDPPGLHAIAGSSGAALRELAKLVHCLCDGRAGETFFAGSLSWGKALACSHVSVIRRFRRLESLGVVRLIWKGGLCRCDPQGNEYANGALVKRASEYVYLGLPSGSG